MRQPRQVAFGSGASAASRIADEVDPHVEVVGLVPTRTSRVLPSPSVRRSC